jgi:hypothetical protein
MNHDRHVGSASRVALAAALVASACGCALPAHGGGGGGSPLPSIQIAATVEDGTTNAGPGPFDVQFFPEGIVPDGPALADLAAHLALRAWPEQTPIPTTTFVARAGTSTTAAVVEVRASQPLAERWYSLDFGPPRDGLHTRQTFDDGTWGVRVRPDSHPAVTLIEFCGAAPSAGWKFYVTFSELVAIENPTFALTVEQNGAFVDCRLNGVVNTQVLKVCNTLTAGPVTVRLVVSSTKGPDGAFLAPQTWNLDVASLDVTQQGCVGYRVPLL